MMWWRYVCMTLRGDCDDRAELLTCYFSPSSLLPSSELAHRAMSDDYPSNPSRPARQSARPPPARLPPRSTPPLAAAGDVSDDPGLSYSTAHTRAVHLATEQGGSTHVPGAALAAVIPDD